MIKSSKGIFKPFDSLIFNSKKALEVHVCDHKNVFEQFLIAREVGQVESIEASVGDNERLFLIVGDAVQAKKTDLASI